MGDAMEKDPDLCFECRWYEYPMSIAACTDCKFGLGMSARWSQVVDVVDNHPPPNDPKALAEAHWGYVKTLLETHDVPAPEVEHIGFHYKSAFIHGYKHAKEEYHEE